MPTEVVETIGSGGDYADWLAWDAATRTLDLPALDEVRIGELIDSSPVSLGTILFMRNAFWGGVSDATRFRWIRPAAGNGYFDGGSGSGAKQQRTGHVARVQEAHARFGSCGSGHGSLALEVSTNAAGGVQRCIRIDRAGWYDSLHLTHFGGQNANNTMLYVGPNLVAGTTLYVTNCNAHGSGADTTAAPTNALYGFRDTSGATSFVHFLNCNAYNVKGGVAGLPLPSPSLGIGFAIATGTSCVNCAATDCGTQTGHGDFVQLSAPTLFSHCLSGDTTASGANSHTGKTAVDTWLRPQLGVFQVDTKGTPGSDLINNGLDVQSLWPIAAAQDADGEDHNADTFGWEIGAYNYNTSVEPDAAVMEFLAPAVARLVGLNPEPAVMEFLAPAVARLVGLNPEPAVMEFLAPAVTRSGAVNPLPVVLEFTIPAVGTELEGALQVPPPVVCFALSVQRELRRSLAISRATRTAARLDVVLRRPLSVATVRRLALQIQRVKRTNQNR